MTETGVFPCDEAVHVLEPQLTIYVCVVRRCWSEPFDRPEVFHKFATPRASEGASNTGISFPARIVILRPLMVLILHCRGVVIFARGTRKRDIAFTGFQGPRQTRRAWPKSFWEPEIGDPPFSALAVRIGFYRAQWSTRIGANHHTVYQMRWPLSSSGTSRIL